MIKLSQKIAPSVFLAIAAVVISGFFGGMSASAKNNAQMEMPVFSNVHCAVQDQEVQNGATTENTLMPCCVERHDNSGTIIPSTIQDRVKFSQILMAQQIDCATNAIDQKIYPSSPSPPPEAENISSTVKIE